MARKLPILNGHSKRTLNSILEYRHSHCRRFSSRIRRSPRWSSAIFSMGLENSQWSTPQCCSSRMGGSSHRHLYHSSLIGGFHLLDLGGRCALSCGLRVNLLRTVLSYPEELPKAEMELREVE